MMNNWDAWDWGLLAVAGYLAVVSLVRLMTLERRRLADELQQRMQAEKLRRREENERNSADDQRAA